MQVDIELCTHTCVVAEEVILVGTRHVGLAHEGIIIVPCIVQTDTADEVQVHGIIVLAAKESDQIQHQVEVGGDILVVILVVVAASLEASLVPHTAHMQS